MINPLKTKGISRNSITSRKIYLRSLTYPYFGIIVLISCPFSCRNKGTFVENSANEDTFAKGIISVVIKYSFLAFF